VIDTRVVFQQEYRDVDIATLPRFLFPSKGRFALSDYEKVFCANPRADIFDARSISRGLGSMVVVRPDQFVATVLPLDGFADLAAYFDNFMLTYQQETSVVVAE
jgi:phenol 2-monooxygenase